MERETFICTFSNKQNTVIGCKQHEIGGRRKERFRLKSSDIMDSQRAEENLPQHGAEDGRTDAESCPNFNKMQLRESERLSPSLHLMAKNIIDNHPSPDPSQSLPVNPISPFKFYFWSCSQGNAAISALSRALSRRLVCDMCESVPAPQTCPESSSVQPSVGLVWLRL